jgi:hypothetical protein
MAFFWRRYVLVPLFAALLGGLTGYAVARVTEGRRWPGLAFASEKWKAAARYERYIFWNDIDRRQLLIGKTREDVVQLLGPPDSEEKGRRLGYVIKGGEGEFMVFLYAVDIHFDGTGRVATARIVTD